MNLGFKREPSIEPNLHYEIRNVPTTRPDHSGQWQHNEQMEERLKRIEQRLSYLEVLLRLQEDDYK